MVEMGEAAAVVGLHLKGLGDGGGIDLVSAGIGRHHAQLIVVGRRKSHDVGTPVRAVVAHQLSVDAGEVGIAATLHVDVIALSAGIGRELHIGRLEPALCLGDAYLPEGHLKVGLGCFLPEVGERHIDAVRIEGHLGQGLIDGNALDEGNLGAGTDDGCQDDE